MNGEFVFRNRLMTIPFKSTQGVNYEDYLTIEALENGLTATLSRNACEYCIDGDGNWKSLSANKATESVNKGQRILFRAELIPSNSIGIGTFSVTKKFNLCGNVMSMLYGDEGKNKTSLEDYDRDVFFNLFNGCTRLISVSSNFLPATTLTFQCYYRMFYGCVNLLNAPNLPANELAQGCYLGMFENCSKLTETPDLHATIIAPTCYGQMFRGCTSLENAPASLPATVLMIQCYYGMFYGCAKLTNAPTLPAVSLVDYCYHSMFYGCTNLNQVKAMFTTTPSDSYTKDWLYNVSSTGVFTKNKNATWNVIGTNGIPNGWTIKTE